MTSKNPRKNTWNTIKVITLLTSVKKSRAQKNPGYFSAWNKYFASAGHRVRQSALRVSHSQFLPLSCIWYAIEFWKPAGHCDQQKTNPVGHTWNRAGQWPMTGCYFMHWKSRVRGRSRIISACFSHMKVIFIYLTFIMLLLRGEGGPESKINFLYSLQVKHYVNID